MSREYVWMMENRASWNKGWGGRAAEIGFHLTLSQEFPYPARALGQASFAEPTAPADAAI